MKSWTRMLGAFLLGVGVGAVGHAALQDDHGTGAAHETISSQTEPASPETPHWQPRYPVIEQWYRDREESTWVASTWELPDARLALTRAQLTEGLRVAVNVGPQGTIMFKGESHNGGWDGSFAAIREYIAPYFAKNLESLGGDRQKLPVLLTVDRRTSWAVVKKLLATLCDESVGFQRVQLSVLGLRPRAPGVIDLKVTPLEANVVARDLRDDERTGLLYKSSHDEHAPGAGVNASFGGRAYVFPRPLMLESPRFLEQANATWAELERAIQATPQMLSRVVHTGARMGEDGYAFAYFVKLIDLLALHGATTIDLVDEGLRLEYRFTAQDVETAK